MSRSSRGVHRTAGPWTPTVHAYLDHLRRAGFDAAPTVVGMDEQGREVLSYVEGEVLGDPAWEPGEPTRWPAYARSEGALSAAGRILRRLHDASRSFAPAAPVWKQHAHPVLLPGEIVCHGDVGPHNTVYRDGLPVALIDWETARPELPLVELGTALWKYVPLGDDAYFARSDFGATPDLPRRVAVFATAYGVTDPSLVRWAVQQSKQRSVEPMRHWPVTPGGAAAYLRVVAGELEWLDGVQDDLVRQLG